LDGPAIAGDQLFKGSRAKSWTFYGEEVTTTFVVDFTWWGFVWNYYSWWWHL